MKLRNSFPWPRFTAGIRRRKVRLLYKIWSLSIPTSLVFIASGIYKCIYPEFGGCPLTGTDPKTGGLAPYCGDHTAGIIFIAMGLLEALFLIYFPGYVAGYWEHEDK